MQAIHLLAYQSYSSQRMKLTTIGIQQLLSQYWLCQLRKSSSPLATTRTCLAQLPLAYTTDSKQGSHFYLEFLYLCQQSKIQLEQAILQAKLILDAADGSYNYLVQFLYYPVAFWSPTWIS